MSTIPEKEPDKAPAEASKAKAPAVPVAVKLSAEEKIARARASEKVAATVVTSARQKLTRETILTMSKPEIRAVAHDRGYKLRGQGQGRRVLAENFLAAQEQDTSLTK
jgi:hypothetical protein